MKWPKWVLAGVIVVFVVLVVRALPAAPSSTQNYDDPGGVGTSQVIDPDAVLTVAPEASGTAVPVDPYAPVLLDPTSPAVTATVGQTLQFVLSDDDQVSATFESDNPEVVDVYPGSDADFFLPAGGDTLAEGTAVVTVTSTTGDVYTFTVTVGPGL